VSVDPASLTDADRERAGVTLLASSQSEALDVLDQSALLRGILGNEPVDATVAVRRYEHDNYGQLNPDELADKFRLAWSL
jgi:glutamine synthetase